VIQITEEVKDISDEADDDDLVPYAKPNFDPEDAKEDPADVIRKGDTVPMQVFLVVSGHSLTGITRIATSETSYPCFAIQSLTIDNSYL